MKKKDIINLAREIKQNWQTNDPYVIAKKIGVLVFNGANVRGFKAHTIKLGSYPTTIWINEAYTDVSKKVLCDHELGHAILHPDNINYFGVTPQNVTKSVEYEANLFALALLVDEKDLSMPLENLSSYAVKSVLDHNIKLQDKN